MIAIKNMMGLFVFLILQYNHAIAQNNWELISPYPPHIAAYSACISQDRAYFWCSNNLVYATYDGGQSFKVLSPYAPMDGTMRSCCSSQGIAFADSLNGYITHFAHGEFRTSDGGMSWQQISTSSVSSILFGDSFTGWKIGGGEIYKTTDTGQSWNYINIPSWKGGEFAKAFALDDKRIWVAKSFYYGRDLEGSIWYSSDSGVNWKRQTTAPTSNDTCEVTYHDLRINTSGKGIAIGEIKNNTGDKYAFVTRTDNFGSTWTTVKLSPEIPQTVLSISDSTWIILGGKDSPYKRITRDAGYTWSAPEDIIPGVSNFLLGCAVYISKYSSIIISTSLGNLVSPNGGENFYIANKFPNFPIDNVSVESNSTDSEHQIITATSYTGNFLISKDAGNTWQASPMPGYNDFHFAQLKSGSGVLYCIPNQLELYKSSDFGISWVEIELPVYGGLRALTVYNKDILVLQAYRALCYSSDGGNSWNKTPLPGNYWFNSANIVSPEVIIAGGAKGDTTGYAGIIYRTSNAGYDWQIIDFPEEINNVKMVSSQVGYASSDHAFYKTTDGGDSWILILSSQDYSEFYDDFYFFDPLTGFINISDKYMKTTDGGSTWDQFRFDVPIWDISNIERTNNGTFYVAGGQMLWRGRIDHLFEEPLNQNHENSILIEDAKLNVYPNPFNPITQIQFELNQKSHATILIYDILGRRVSELANDTFKKGIHSVLFDATNLASGFYFVVLSSNQIIKAKKILHVK